MKFEQFPYEPRPNQKEIVQNIHSCLREEKSLVYQAATGSGKTICTLVPTLRYAQKHGKKVLYLTRTNSQQRQVLLEMREMGGHHGIGLQGRSNTCLLAEEEEELKEGDSEELSKYCSDRKKEVRTALEEGKEGDACPYYAGMLECDLDKIRERTKRGLPTVDEFMDYCRENGLCAYELTKALLPDASLVTAPYIYFFMPFLRKRLLDWMNVELSDLIVIVDEAHNLPNYARELSSTEITEETLDRARTESQEFDDPILQQTDRDARNALTISTFCEMFKGLMEDIAEEFVVEDDGLIPPTELRSELLYTLGLNTNQLKGIIKELKVQGEIVQEKRRDEKKLPRSYINSIGSFLNAWFFIGGKDYVKLVNGGENKSLEGYCLDPSNSTEVLQECHSTIHQSATLEPLDEYRDSVGLPGDTERAIYPSPFPEKNKALLYSDEMTTKYETLKRDDGMMDRIRKTISDVISKTDRNTIVFFPSYRLMDEIIQPMVEEMGNTFVEERGMTQSELMGLVGRFKKKGGVLFSVIGGRISEGMDFPGGELELALVVGIPYPKPTARQKGLKHYYDIKFNKGWEYTVKAPATRKILQATGRLVRSENDLGVALILDERAVHFKQYLEGLQLVERPAESIREFFDSRE